jgi:hypothetical protein
MGNARTVVTRDAVAVVTVTPSPSYVTSGARLARIEPGEARYVAKPPDMASRIDALGTPGRWVVQQDRDTELETFAFDYITRQGRFDIQPADDPSRGPCTEVRLVPQPEIPDIASHYVALRAPTPIAIDGQPTELGLWVLGNSSWGRVTWEFLDAKDERWVSLGEEPERWNVSDWESNTNINFDGWQYLKTDLPRPYADGHPGPRDRNWRHRFGDGKVDFPIRFSRLLIELRDKVVYVTDMVPVPVKSIRIQDLTAGYGNDRTEPTR